MSIGPQRLERGNQPKHNAGQDGDAQRIEEHVAVERDPLRARQAACQSGNQNAHAQLCQDESDTTAGNAEQHALRKQLANHSRGIGSECGANRKFAGSARRTREKQIGNVGARDQEHKADRAEQHQQDSFHVADDVGLERDQGDARAFVRFGISYGQVLGDAAHFGAGLIEGDARFQPADRVHAHADAPVAKRGIVPLTDGHENIRVAQPGEVTGGDTNNRVGFAVQRDVLSQYVLRGAKFATPKPVAEDGHGAGASFVFLGAKCASENRLHAEGGEKLRRNHVRVNAFRFAGAGHIEIVGPEGTQGSEGLAVSLPVEEVGIGDGTFLEGRRLGVDGDQFVGARERQWIEEHAVDDREQGGVGSDSQSKRQDGDRGETGILRQYTQSITDVLPEAHHWTPLSRTPARLQRFWK